MTKSYSELLRDPRWQKKRLEIMALDRFQCRQCNSTIRTLNVHHLWYENGKNPWEYPDQCFITLCENCHELMPNINWQMAFLNLNLTEAQLLDLAHSIHYIVNRNWEKVKQIIESKYSTRCWPDDQLLDLVDFKDMEEVDFFYKSNKEFIHKYVDSKFLQ